MRTFHIIAVIIIVVAIGVFLGLLLNQSSMREFGSRSGIPVLNMNIIHMLEQTNRKKHLDKVFQSYEKINFVFREAITPTHPRHKEFCNQYKAKLSRESVFGSGPSEIACCLSHFYTAMETGILAHPTLSDWVIIGEDDMEPLPDLKAEEITRIVYKTLSSAPSNVKYIYFTRSNGLYNHSDGAPVPVLKSIEVVNNSVDTKTKTFISGAANGTVCYAIRRSFAKDTLFPAFTASESLSPLDQFITEFFCEPKHRHEHIPLMINRFPFSKPYEGNGMFFASDKLESTLIDDRLIRSNKKTTNQWQKYFSEL